MPARIMKIKHRETGHLGSASRYNPSAISPAEMIVWFEDGSASSEYVKDWDPADPTLQHAHLLQFLESREP
jgi:hypothetical protein